MPKGRPARGRKQHAGEVAAVESVQKFETVPDRPLRPRTRAWVKQEENRRKEAAVAPSSAIPQVTPRQSGHQKPRVLKSGLPAPREGRTQTSRGTISRGRGNKRPSATKAPPAKQQAERKTESRRQRETTVIERPRQRRGTAGSQASAFSAWLSRLEPPSPELVHQARDLYRAPVSGITYRSEGSMESSSTSRDTRDNESTAKATGSRSVKVTETKLRHRRVNRTPTTDGRLEHLRSILKTSLPERPLKDIEDLRSVAREFLQQIVEHPDDSCYPYIDDFSFNFDEGKSKIRYPVVNRRYFEADLKRCRTKNEAVLQRTIMIHIINQYWLGKIFDWNTEGLWSQPKDVRLPSREDDEISLPKPDLTISFTLKSFTGEEDDSDPIPQDLQQCISPDGGDRCFPFLFFEVKKAGADLQEAFMANLYNASQALYNIYLWMVRAGQEDTFFETVRVFSFVFNAQDLSVRVHRAERLRTAGGALSFHFDEFSPLARYTKDQACLLIQTILADYAAQELHPALKATFIEIVNQEDIRVASKRRANVARNPSSKRTRRDQNTIQQTGQSFAMSHLTT